MSAVTSMIEDPASALEELMEMLEEAAGPATAVGLIGLANMIMPRNAAVAGAATAGLSAAALSGSPPSNFNGPQPGQPGGGSSPTANTPSAIEAQNVFQLLQNGAIAGISGVGIGPLVAVFGLAGTTNNFRATAGIFEEINVQRRRRRGIREQIGSFVKPIQRMVKGMIQIRRYEHTIHIKMAHLILIICCCNFLK